MFPYIPFETAIEMLVVAYFTCGIVILAVSKICLIAIESFEEGGN